MKEERKKSVVLAIIGIVIGCTMSIVFSSSKMIIALIPVLGALGGLIGTLIDKRRLKNQQ